MLYLVDTLRLVSFLELKNTCDNPHTATLHTEPSTDTAAQITQSSPNVRDDGNNAEGCGNLVSPGSCVAPQSVSSPKDEDGEVEHTSTLKLPSQVSESQTQDKQQEEDDSDSKSTIHTAIREKVRDNTYLSATHMAVKYNKKKGGKTQVFSVGDKVTIAWYPQDGSNQNKHAKTSLRNNGSIWRQSKDVHAWNNVWNY